MEQKSVADYKELIANGKSVRSFKEISLSEGQKEELNQFGMETERLIPSIQLDERIMGKENLVRGLEKISGYHGFSIDAPNYIVLLSQGNKNCLTNAGYVGQSMILKAQELGLSSCWITVNDSLKIKKAFGLKSSLFVAGLIALGYMDQGVAKKIVRQKGPGPGFEHKDIYIHEISTDNTVRLGLENFVFLDQWDNKADNESLRRMGLLDAFSYACLAPSTLNSQPWRFLVRDGAITLAVDRMVYEKEKGSLEAGIVMLYLDLILENTIQKPVWNFNPVLPEQLVIPEKYAVIAQCGI